MPLFDETTFLNILNMKRKILLLTLILVSSISYGQYSQLQLKDTTRTKYPYKLPILGAKAYSKGFDIPYSAGGMLNFFTAKQDIVIPEIAVGFSDGILPNIPLTDISNFVEFSNVNASATSINFRPDLWILPFANVYGIFGKTWAHTNVELSYPITLKANADLEGTSVGFGVTGAGGLGKYFFVLDGNWIWTNMSNFEAPVRSYTFSTRLGRAFHVGKNPESNIALWAGGMRIKMGGITQGTITLGDILPEETWQKKDEIVGEYWDWYNNLNPILDAPKKAIADKLFTPIINKIDEADGSGIIQYRLRKEPKQKWNVIIGAQYQINKHHQLRTEGGIIGNRKSLLLSYNYRFGI